MFLNYGDKDQFFNFPQTLMNVQRKTDAASLPDVSTSPVAIVANAMKGMKEMASDARTSTSAKSAKYAVVQTLNVRICQAATFASVQMDDLDAMV